MDSHRDPLVLSKKALTFKRKFYVYIVTNPGRTVLYMGVTNDIWRRLIEHFFNRGGLTSFAGKYYCYELIFYEEFDYIWDAISREKEIKKWRRAKKVNLISEANPNWKFLNEEFFDSWPPSDEDIQIALDEWLKNE